MLRDVFCLLNLFYISILVTILTRQQEIKNYTYELVKRRNKHNNYFFLDKKKRNSYKNQFEVKQLLQSYLKTI